MHYGQMPLWPPMKPSCDQEACVKVPLFRDDCCGMQRPPSMQECQRVLIENPCRPGECAEVILGVDACGNLMVCVRRDPHWDCCMKPRPDCRPPKPPRPPKPNPCRPCRPMPDCDPCRKGNFCGF